MFGSAEGFPLSLNGSCSFTSAHPACQAHRCVLFFKELLVPSISSTCLWDFYQCLQGTPKVSFLGSFSVMGVRGRDVGGTGGLVGTRRQEVGRGCGPLGCSYPRSPLSSSFFSCTETSQSIPPLVRAPWSIKKAPHHLNRQ